MMKYLRYLRYITVHKWFVMVSCFERGLFWRGLVHDLSKLLPSEFFAYANYFYGGHRDAVPEAVDRAFDKAWLLHQHRNPHHWQFWVLREDSGATKVMDMPKQYVKEMVCDWVGAGRAITGKTGTTCDWYKANREQMLLSDNTRRRVEELLLAENEMRRIALIGY